MVEAAAATAVESEAQVAQVADAAARAVTEGEVAVVVETAARVEVRAEDTLRVCHRRRRLGRPPPASRYCLDWPREAQSQVFLCKYSRPIRCNRPKGLDTCREPKEV